MNNKTNKLIPDLRFPEFSSKGNWQMEELGEYLDYIQPTNYLVSSSIYNDNFKVPVLTAGKTFILGYTDEVDGVFSENLPVIIFDDFTTASKYVDFPFKAKSSAMKILLPKDDTSCKFFFESIQNINYTPGVHQRHWISIFSKLKVPVPETSEQQKVADCLSSLDDLIASNNDKLDILKTYKKGLIQSIFPQKEERLPKLRFKEFEKDGEWVEKVVKDVAYYENGRAHEQDIAENGKYIVVNSKFISTDGEVKKFTNKPFCLASKNDILMVLSDVPNGRAIAKCFYVDKDDFYSVNQRICKISPFDINSKLLMYLLNRNSFLLSFDDGIKQTNLRNEDVINCPLIIPKNPIEQQKIADTLSFLDDLINEQSNKIDQLRSHKMGLMQGLFPKVSI